MTRYVCRNCRVVSDDPANLEEHPEPTSSTTGKCSADCAVCKGKTVFDLLEA